MRSRMLVNGLVVISAVATGVWATMRPWHVFAKQNAQSEKRVEEMNHAEAHRIQLLAEQDRAQSSIGREESSRKAGFVGPGEVASSVDKN